MLEQYAKENGIVFNPEALETPEISLMVARWLFKRNWLSFGDNPKDRMIKTINAWNMGVKNTKAGKMNKKYLKGVMGGR